MCPPCYQRGGSLLHCLSTLTCFHAVYFCCTVSEVAFAGRYPAPCPLKPGLSSPASLRIAAATICLTQNPFILAYFFWAVQTCTYIFLHIQTASTDKLPDNRCLRNRLTVDRKEIVQEFEEPFCLIILFPVSRDIEEQRFRIELQYRKLIHKRGVKHHIGALLVREDILVLAAAHRRPALDRL